ncbi:DgyrCDS9181 [Dimorphilus gyrociliatus]|uniref:DgyrCDS9181 n=1 Tax=Dimorphilus gyrociliatus TaxID=2664684 RepID=A0A7I8VWM7_9ANNE|nr:DgyrCDS9181 [Dimorphilus gyrociliatus]
MESPLGGQMNPEKRIKLDCNVSKEEINNTKEKEEEKEENDKQTTQQKDETGEKDNNVENKSLDDSKIGASESIPSTTSTNQKESVLKKRCNECRIKLNPALREIGRCKCGKVFCQLHRLPEQHICEFDHKEEGRREARQKMVNPEKQMGNNMERLQ